MADKPFEADDPLELRGVELPVDRATIEDMAYVFAEELLRTGLDAARLLRIFSSPHYAGPHHAYRMLGEPAIRAIVAECARVFGPGRAGGDLSRAGATEGA